jgi:hypothetical protein
MSVSSPVWRAFGRARWRADAGLPTMDKLLLKIKYGFEIEPFLYRGTK